MGVIDFVCVVSQFCIFKETFGLDNCSVKTATTYGSIFLNLESIMYQNMYMFTHMDMIVFCVYSNAYVGVLL